LIQWSTTVKIYAKRMRIFAKVTMSERMKYRSAFKGSTALDADQMDSLILSIVERLPESKERAGVVK
jgi:hypothetical protein